MDNKTVQKNGDSEIIPVGSDIKPKLTISEAEKLAERLYGIVVKDIKEIIAYDDRNFIIQEDKIIKNPIITNNWPHGYVLKIVNAHDSKKTSLFEAQNEALIYLRNQKIECPNPVANVYGKYFSVEKLNGVDHIVRLLEFIPGKIFNQVPKSNYLFFSSGEYLAKVDRALKTFHNEVYLTHRTNWMLQEMPQIKDFLHALPDHGRKQIVEEVIEKFETKVLAHIDDFDKQIIHGDYNEQNILVGPVRPNSDEYKVTGVIDFGDTSLSPVIFELAIAMTYIILDANDLAAGGIVMAGYTSIKPIPKEDLKFIKTCVAARLCQSLVMGAYTYTIQPTNDYVLVTQKKGWPILEELWKEKFEEIDEIWETAADNYLKQSTK
ncbi:HYKK family protein [Megaselia abdita]